MLFFAYKSDTFSAFIKYFKRVTNEKGITIVAIRSDHGGEFDNSLFESFCNENGMMHNFLAPRIPQ